MSELIFGVIWTIFIAFFTLGAYGTNGNVTVNGNLVSHDEFSSMLFPKIIIGLFWVIGFWLIFQGLKKIIKDSTTNKNGEICFGKICNIYHSGTYVNGYPELKADILVFIPSTQETKTISEIIGFDINKYQIDSYVRLKYYNGDVNIEDVVDSSILPLNAQDILVSSRNTENYNMALNDTIVIDGVEYVRKDSINSYKEM